MAFVLALGLLVAQVTDDTNIPPPYAPPPDEIAAPDDPPPALPAPHAYLYQAYPSLARKLDCMIQRESSWNPSARSGPYVGLAQFDYPTWLETPTGRTGASRTDPYASIDAMAWGYVHLGPRRWPITSRIC